MNIARLSFLLTYLTNLVLFVFVPLTANAQSIEWNQKKLTPRYGHTLIFDPIRAESVLFGGRVGAASAETWRFDGFNWKLHQGNGPSKRYDHDMVFDSTRGVSVLFGGNDDGFSRNDTWEWNGTNWTHRMVNGPSWRLRHAMAFDSRRGVTVLFGGITNNQGNAETWEWNGNLWVQRSLPGPSQRAGHKMIFDSARGVTVLFGGLVWCCGGTWQESQETWEYDGAAWSLRADNGPSARILHSMFYDPVRQVAVLFGGAAQWDTANASLNSDTWEWNGVVWTQMASPGPSARCGAAMCLNSSGIAVLFGGVAANGYSAEQWEFSSGNWIVRSIGGPSPRFSHAMTFDSNRDVAVLFGGLARGGPPQYSETLCSDTWLWRTGSSWNRRPVAGPSARGGHSMAFDSDRGVTVLFGGATSTSVFQVVADTWEWDGTRWTIRAGPQPRPRTGSAMTYDTSRRKIMMFGGQIGSQNVHIGDTWEWDGVAWMQVSSSGPSPRSFHAMTYDTARHVTVLFGGVTDAASLTFSDQTWEWNGATWTQRVTTGPSGRLSHTMAYDPDRNVTVLMGGFVYYEINDEMWEWNGTSWTQRLISRPSARRSSAMIYDSARQEMILFGGNLYAFSAETWRLGCNAPSAAAIPEYQTTCSEGSASFQLNLSGTPPFTFQWQYEIEPGVWSNLFDDRVPGLGLVTGSATSQLTISSFELGAAGTYRCMISNSCGESSTLPAVLSICRIDHNCDSIVDHFDYLDFVAALAEGSLAADFNGDGAADFFDYLDFVQTFATSC